MLDKPTRNLTAWWDFTDKKYMVVDKDNRIRYVVNKAKRGWRFRIMWYKFRLWLKGE